MPGYDFRSLSPLDLEELVRDLLQAEWGVFLETFAPGPDSGIDIRFATSKSGSTIVQVKHYVESGFNSLLGTLRKEREKVLKLSPSRYIIATSVSLTPAGKTKIIDAMPGIALSVNDILGQSELNNLLGKNPNVERKHFKLWLTSAAVLQRIVHAGIYERSQAELDQIRLDIQRFVDNSSVAKAAAVLDKQNTVIISGRPGVGKTTLARMLLWKHAEDGWEISVVDDISETFVAFSETAKRVLFFDDFLGQVRLTPDSVRAVDQRLPPFLKRVKSSKSTRFIMTTRDYILHQAQSESEKLNSSDFKLSEFTLDVGTYTKSVKSKMLFNHIYFSTLSSNDKNELLEGDYYLEIIKHRNFNPRIISFLTSADYLDISKRPIREVVSSILENPQVLWEIPYRKHISTEARALMLAKYFNGERVTFEELERSFKRLVSALNIQISPIDMSSRFRSAVRELEGSVLAIEGRTIRFSNPGVEDFLQSAVVEDNLLPEVIGEISEYRELRKAVEVWLAEARSESETLISQDGWSGAFERVILHNPDLSFDLLTLLIRMRLVLCPERWEAMVRQQLEHLVEIDAEDIDIEKAVELLRDFSDEDMPDEIHSVGLSILTSKVSGLIEFHGPYLPLDEFEHLVDRAALWGDSSDDVRLSARNALDQLIKDLSSRLEELSSMSELDDYEKQLRKLSIEYGLDLGGSEEYKISDRRSDLFVKEGESYQTDWSTPSIDGDMSDAEVRSLFGALKQT